MNTVVYVNPDGVIVVDEEILEPAKKLTEKKTAGPDGIPNIALKFLRHTLEKENNGSYKI